jgi:quercetin dioxygenase-like cupin family protein
MKVIRAAEAMSGGESGRPEMFAGDVTLRSVAQAQPGAGVAIVRFRDGARNHWHSHAGGQVLYVLEGPARVQSEGGEVVHLEPGDFVIAEPGEKHWHGAAEGADMAHISIASGASEWFSPVED